MLTPRYYFAEDFRGFYHYFLAQPHEEKIFRKGELLWRPGQPCDRIHYFISGAAVHFAEHGDRKAENHQFPRPWDGVPRLPHHGFSD